MNEIIYRSIFPDCNIPKLHIAPKTDKSFEQNIGSASISLAEFADFSKIKAFATELEFKNFVETDPVAALLQKLQEFSNRNEL